MVFIKYLYRVGRPFSTIYTICGYAHSSKSKCKIVLYNIILNIIYSVSFPNYDSLLKEQGFLLGN